jgi:hypothetical protein
MHDLLTQRHKGTKEKCKNSKSKYAILPFPLFPWPDGLARRTRPTKQMDRNQAMRIEIHIERLLLEGLPLDARDGARVQAAVEAELARLLAERPSADAIAHTGESGAALPRLAAPRIDLAPGARPAEVGAQIAQSVLAAVLPSA